MTASEIVFRSRTSRAGVISSLVFILLCLSPLAMMAWAGGSTAEALVASAFSLAIALWAAFMLLLLGRMRYRLRAEAMDVECGPFRWSIPFGEITSAAVTNLKYHPTSTGWKLPGFALFNVFYADRGTVRMCASSITRQILLIETTRGRYGITPDHPVAFLAELERRRQS